MRLFLHRFLTFTIWSLVLSTIVGAALWYTNLSWHNPSGHVRHDIGDVLLCVGVIGLLGLLFLCIPAGIIWAAVYGARQGRLAMAPIPSWEQIAQQIKASTGKDPSLQDVLAVEHRLKQEKHIAGAKAAGAFVGLNLIGKRW